MPFDFNCPHCNAPSRVDDEYSGQRGPCAECGKEIKLPRRRSRASAKAVAMLPPHDTRPAPSRSMSKIALATLTVVGLAIFSLAVRFVYQGYSTVQTIHCVENLKSIAYSSHSHEEYSGSLPTTTQNDSRYPVGWRANLWWNVEVDKLANYDLEAPYVSPQNLRAAAKVTAFQCPLSNTVDGNTSYFAVFSLPEDEHQTCFVADQPLTLDDISDGASNTLYAVEASSSSPRVLWNGPVDLEWNKMNFMVNNDQQQQGIGSLHGGFWYPPSAPVVMVDASVRFLSNEVDPTIVRKLLLRNDGQDVEFPYLD